MDTCMWWRWMRLRVVIPKQWLSTFSKEMRLYYLGICYRTAKNGIHGRMCLCVDDESPTYSPRSSRWLKTMLPRRARGMDNTRWVQGLQIPQSGVVVGANTLVSCSCSSQQHLNVTAFLRRRACDLVCCVFQSCTASCVACQGRTVSAGISSR